MALLLTLSISGCLTACTAEENAYVTEQVTGKVEEGSEVMEKLHGMLLMLAVDTTEIPEFTGEREAQEYFRDSVLNYMCCVNYNKYAGNTALLQKLAESEADCETFAAVPAADFEHEMYRVFGGGVKLSHKGTELFRYLKTPGVYVPVSRPIESATDTEILSAEETANTYRVRFSVSAGERRCEYFALFIKREDGNPYFYTVMRDT